MENNEELDIETVATDDAEPRIYEVGYHIIPSVTEENISAEEGAIKGIISAQGGTVISGESPRRAELAYTIERVAESKREKFDTASFGWIKFDIDPAKIATLKEAFDANKQMLRYIIFKTVRENTRSDVHPASARSERKGTAKEPAKAPVIVIEKPTTSEAELDRTIEELVVE